MWIKLFKLWHYRHVRNASGLGLCLEGNGGVGESGGSWFYSVISSFISSGVKSFTFHQVPFIDKAVSC